MIDSKMPYNFSYRYVKYVGYEIVAIEEANVSFARLGGKYSQDLLQTTDRKHTCRI